MAKKPKRATIDKLGELHGVLAEDLMKRIKDGEVVQTKEGDVVTISCSVAALNVARQFLRDNGIQADAETNPQLKDLVSRLPFKDANGDDEEEANVH